MRVPWLIFSLCTTLLLLLGTAQGRSIISHQEPPQVFSRGLESGADAASDSPRPLPEFVLRGEHGRTPSQVQQAGGFYARAFEMELRGNPLQGLDVQKSYSLWWHQAPQWSQSQWISTTTDPNIAAQYARSKSAGFIYKVHADPRLVHIEDCQGEYARYTTLSEWAAAQRIAADQIMGWWDVTGMKEKDMVKMIESETPFTPNPQYNEAKYSEQRASSPQYQLAGFPKHHKASLQEPWSEFAEADLADSVNKFVKETVFKGDEQRYKEFRTAPPTPAEKPTTDPWQSDSFQLYLVHDKDPSALRESGGFQPTDPMMSSDESFSIAHHVQDGGKKSAYVSAFNSHIMAINAQDAEEGFVYHVQPAPNSIPVDPTLKAAGTDGLKLPEGVQVHAAMGGIAWGQVRGWAKFKIRGSGEQRMLDGLDYNINAEYDRRYDGLSALVDETEGERGLAGIGENTAAEPGDSLRDRGMKFLENAAYNKKLMWTGQAPLIPNLAALVPMLKDTQAAFKSLKLMVETESGTFESPAAEKAFLERVAVGVETVLEGAHRIEHAMDFHAYGEYFLGQQDGIEITPSLSKTTMFARTLYAMGWNAGQNAEISRLGWKVRDARVAGDSQKAQKAYDELVEKIKQVKQYITNGIMDNVAISGALENGATMDQIRELVWNQFTWPSMADGALLREAHINQMVASIGFRFLENIDGQHTAAHIDVLKAQGKWVEPEPEAPEPEPESAGVPWGELAVGFFTSLIPNPVALVESIGQGIDIGRRVLGGEHVELSEIIEATVSIVGEVSSFVPAAGAVAAVAKGAKAVGKISKIINKVRKAAGAVKNTVKATAKAVKKSSLSVKKLRKNFKVSRKAAKGSVAGPSKTVNVLEKGTEGVAKDVSKNAAEKAAQEKLLQKLCAMEVCKDELPTRVMNTLKSKLKNKKLAVALPS